jgi:hypothetical protein
MALAAFLLGVAFAGASQARDDHDSPATASDHPAAGAGL